MSNKHIRALVFYHVCHAQKRRALGSRMATNNVAPGHAHQFDFQLAAYRNTLQQGVQTRSTMLRSVAFKCCDRFAGACKCWANNVGICCVEMLLSFGGALATGSANVLPVQVKYESDIITETANENRSSNSDFRYRTKTEDEKRK